MTDEKPFHGLTPEEAELLVLLAEECGEAVQAVAKILRHGIFSTNREMPVGHQETNASLLEKELGQILLAVELLACIGLVDRGSVLAASLAKAEMLQRYLHHHTIDRSVAEDIRAAYHACLGK